MTEWRLSFKMSTAFFQMTDERRVGHERTAPLLRHRRDRRGARHRPPAGDGLASPLQPRHAPSRRGAVLRTALDGRDHRALDRDHPRPARSGGGRIAERYAVARSDPAGGAPAVPPRGTTP